MKPALQLNISQQLAMTPQLQQAIRLLQLSSIDLQQEIQAAVESNPLLEIKEPNTSNSNDDNSSANSNNSTSSDNHESSDNSYKDSAVWENNYGSARKNLNNDDFYDSAQNQVQIQSLQDYLLWQLNLTPMTEQDNAIAHAIIDAINDNGYLTVTLEEIQESMQQHEPPELDEIAAVLHRIQNFDPVGVACRNLQECLLIQLNQLDAEDKANIIAKNIILNHIDKLAKSDYKKLQQIANASEVDVKAAIALIRSLNPHPGTEIDSHQPEYITPDVFIKKQNNTWVVEINKELTPKLQIKADYAALIKRATSSADNQFLRNNLQEAKWLLKSLENRNDTLIKVTTCIMQHQQQFLEHGPEAMRALVLADIAKATGLHESTISRVTNRKYVRTPQGIFELKYFFSSHLQTANGGECSSTAIRAVIKKIVAEENSAKPLSDNKIADLLSQQGIKVARRTIAKYREALGIPSSSDRRKNL